MQLLRELGHRAIPVNPAFGEILGEKCYPKIVDVPEPIDTVTLYLGKARSDPLVDDILRKRPRRIIMNPGAESDALASRARAQGVEVVQDCTLVMLRSGTY